MDLFKILSLSLILLFTQNIAAQNTDPIQGTPVSGEWYGWSNMMLMNNDGVINGTYSDTWEMIWDMFNYTSQMENGEANGENSLLVETASSLMLLFLKMVKL